jgi:hypothetical protein
MKRYWSSRENTLNRKSTLKKEPLKKKGGRRSGGVWVGGSQKTPFSEEEEG